MRPNVLALSSTLLFLSILLFSTASQARNTQQLDWLDDLLRDQLSRLNISGATVAWVKDGRPRLLRGYGLADRSRGRKVDEHTPFRLASVSKLFVWTALWKLAEQGKIDLDGDVGNYLCGASVPATFQDPITVRHLMDHTAGFDARRRGTFARHESDLVSLGDLLTNELPPRVRAPGRVESYSNIGTCLAAYVVECVSGVPFAKFVRESTLEPLGLEHTTSEQPLPGPLADLAARGYVYREGLFEEQPFELVRQAPAGAMSASASDMAVFMLGLLGAHPTWLSPYALQRMQRNSHVNHPHLGGLANGFFVSRRHGLRVLWHGGDTVLFHSLIMIVPSHDLGVFVSYNGPGGAQGYREVMEAVIDSIEPAPPRPTPSNWNPPSITSGTYRSSRVAATTYEKLEALGGDYVVKLVDGEVDAFGKRWAPIEPWVFAASDGDDRLVFELDGKGNVERMRLASRPMQTFERIPFWRSSGVHWGIALVCAIVLSSPVIWIPASFRRRRREDGRAGAWAMVFGALGCVSGLLLLLCVVLLLRRGTEALNFGVPTEVRIGEGLFVVLALSGSLCAVTAFRVWRARVWSVGRHVHLGLVLVALVVLMVWGAFWGLAPIG